MINKAVQAEGSRERSTGITRSAVLLLLLLGAAYITNAMDRQSFPVLVPAISKQFNFPLAQGGLMSSVFAIGIGITGIPAGYLLTRFSRKTLLVVGMLVYSVGTLLTAVSIGFGDMLVYRIVSGIGEGLQNAALFSAVGAFFAYHSLRATALGTLSIGYSLGAFVGPAWAGQLVGPHGWQSVFYIYGVLGLAAAAIIWIAIPKWFSEVKAPEVAPSAAKVQHVPDKVLNRNVILTIIAIAFFGLGEWGYIALLSTYMIKVQHIKPPDAGFTLSMFGIGSLVGPFAGLIGDRISQRWVLIVGLLCTMVTATLTFNILHTTVEFSIATLLIGVFLSALLYNNFYAFMQRSVRPQYIGLASGLFITAFYITSGVTGYLFGSLVGAFGWGTAAILQLGLLPLVGVVALFFTKPEEQATA